MLVIKKRLSSEVRKIEILKAAWRVCAKKGFSEATLDEIAKEAKVSRALIIQHFKNKENLYGVLIDFLFETHPLEKDLNIVKYIHKKDDIGVFKAFWKHIYTHMLKNGNYSPLKLIFFSMLERPKLYKKHYRKRITKGIEILERYILERIKEGTFREVNPHYVVISFFFMIIQLIIHELIFPEIFNQNVVSSIMETMIQILVDGLKEGGEKWK